MIEYHSFNEAAQIWEFSSLVKFMFLKISLEIAATVKVVLLSGTIKTVHINFSPNGNVICVNIILKWTSWTLTFLHQCHDVSTKTAAVWPWINSTYNSWMRLNKTPYIKTETILLLTCFLTWWYFIIMNI